MIVSQINMGTLKQAGLGLPIYSVQLLDSTLVLGHANMNRRLPYLKSTCLKCAWISATNYQVTDLQHRLSSCLHNLRWRCGWLYSVRWYIFIWQTTNALIVRSASYSTTHSNQAHTTFLSNQLTGCMQGFIYIVSSWACLKGDAEWAEAKQYCLAMFITACKRAATTFSKINITREQAIASGWLKTPPTNRPKGSDAVGHKIGSAYHQPLHNPANLGVALIML